MMTNKTLALLVQHHASITTSALLGNATSRAEQGGCKATPVQVDKYLAICLQMAAHGINERLAQPFM